eukprot:8898151-Pyramimonas_sp.AAC.1
MPNILFHPGAALDMLRGCVCVYVCLRVCSSTWRSRWRRCVAAFGDIPVEILEVSRAKCPQDAETSTVHKHPLSGNSHPRVRDSTPLVATLHAHARLSCCIHQPRAHP